MDDVNKLLTANFIREEYYLEWLANVIMVKSKEEKDHLDNLKETFNTLKQYSMKLNPTKCTFGVSSGKFLDFMVL